MQLHDDIAFQSTSRLPAVTRHWPLVTSLVKDHIFKDATEIEGVLKQDVVNVLFAFLSSTEHGRCLLQMVENVTEDGDLEFIDAAEYDEKLAQGLLILILCVRGKNVIV